MTWAVRVAGTSVAVFDLPLSLASAVCETVGCGWVDLDPESNPSHLTVLIAAARSSVDGEPFDTHLIAAAALTLREALDLLEVTGAD